MAEQEKAERTALKRVAGVDQLIADLVQALEASEREYENLDESAPVDAGCIECTVGTVPNNRNTGLCAHHLRRAALSKARP